MVSETVWPLPTDVKYWRAEELKEERKFQFPRNQDIKNNDC